MNRNFAYSISIFSLLFFSFLFTQTTLAQNWIVKEEGKFGITIKKKGGSIQVLKPKFDSIVQGAKYNDNFYLYKKKGKWGVLHIDWDKEKSFIDTDPEFDRIECYCKLPQN